MAMGEVLLKHEELQVVGFLPVALETRASSFCDILKEPGACQGECPSWEYELSRINPERFHVGFTLAVL